MSTRRTERTDAPVEETVTDASEPGKPATGNLFQRAVATHRRGSGSLVNISLYAVGLSGLWTALGTPLLPIKIEEILADGSSILGFAFDENDKNGALGIVSLIGLTVAALIQPLSGMLSDRRLGPTKRLPFLLAGAIGMAGSVLFFGFAGTLVALVILNMLIQGMGNFAQGAANGLIADHVDKGSKGSAAGALNLSRVIGAGVLTGIVLLMMSQYDADTSPGWMIASVILLATVVIASTLWTVTSLWLNGPVVKQHVEIDEESLAHVDESESPHLNEILPHDHYLRFLIALTVVTSGFSALQLYSFFYLEDVIGLDNPAQGGVVILITTAIATALTVMPAGKMTDRVGRDPMLFLGGALGVLATVILIFASSIIVVALVGLIIGVVIGIFLTVSWALANDLVSRRHAARDLGYASIAVLIGSAVSRISGLGVDRLNDVQDALGYQVVLGAVAFCFVLTVALMTRLSADPVTEAAEAFQEQPTTK